MLIDRLLTLQAVLTGSVSTTQLDVHVVYRDWTPEGETAPPYFERTSTNNATAVTILTAPVLNPQREVASLTIYNADVSTQIVTVKTVSATVSTIAVKQTLLPGKTLGYKELGWYVI